MRPVTPADVLSFFPLSDTQITPDGNLVAFVRSKPAKDKQHIARSQIWVVPTTGGAAQPYTSGTCADWAPRWSPNGRALAFLSNRENERTQVFLLDRDGGEARRLTQVRGEIHEHAWSPDGTRIAFLMSDPQPEDAEERRRRGDDVIMFEHHHCWQRVWTVDIATGELQQITTGDVQVWEFGWAPDGGFALVTSAEPYEWSWFQSAVAYVGPEGGEPQTMYTAPEKCFARPRITPDGKHVAFLSGIWSDRGINAGDLLTVELGARSERLDSELQAASPKPLVSNLSDGYNGNIWWHQFAPDNQTIDFMAYEQGEAAIGRIDLATGERTSRWRGEAAFSESFASHYVADDGTIALVRSEAALPAEVWVAKERTSEEAFSKDNSKLKTQNLELAWTRLTNFNMHASELAIGETRTLRWTSTDGLEIQGLLILPVGYQAGQRVPMITWVHGGPAWLYTHTSYVASRGLQMFASAGYAVFLPNPRGSAGWGVPFLEMNIGDFGGKDYEDIISGIDALITQGIADGERLGIGGWSYGGFMTAWAISQTTRFKAAMAGAAIINWRSFHGAAHIGLWDRVAMRANPYEQGNLYAARSPITFAARISTPTLIQHGENDRIVPVDQGYELFRALKDHGVPVEMAIYPREGHGIVEREHQLDRMRRWLEWFHRYV